MIGLRSRLLLRAVVGGVIAGLAPGGAGPFLMLPGLALLWSLNGRPCFAAIWGLLAVLISHRWLLYLHPLTWIGVPALLSLPITLGIWLFCGFVGGLLISLWAILSKKLSPLDTRKVLVLCFFWGFAEELLASSPIFWIGVGGSTLPLDSSLAGLSSLIGAGGLAALQVFWAYSISLLSIRRMFFILLSFLITHGFGAFLLNNIPAADAKLSTNVWQPSIPTREKFSTNSQSVLVEKLDKALKQSKMAGNELLIAPEGTLPLGWSLDSNDQTFISGGFRLFRGKQRSSLLLFKPGSSTAIPLLDKHRLVPLGEWLPPFLPIEFGSGLSAVGGINPGSPSRLVTGFKPNLGVAICYELSNGHSLAAASARGAKWLLTIANLDPYPPLLQRQFLSLAQLRAIESGRDILSVANTGPTAIIRANGLVEFLLIQGKEGLAKTNIDLYSHRTLYARISGLLAHS